MKIYDQYLRPGFPKMRGEGAFGNNAEVGRATNFLVNLSGIVSGAHDKNCLDIVPVGEIIIIPRVFGILYIASSADGSAAAQPSDAQLRSQKNKFGSGKDLPL